MEVIIDEAPGGILPVYVCPTCSRFHNAFAVENGEPKLTFRREGDAMAVVRTEDPPATCRRCGSPMDVEKALKFQDDMAVAAAAPLAGLRRVTVKV